MWVFLKNFLHNLLNSLADEEELATLAFILAPVHFLGVSLNNDGVINMLGRNQSLAQLLGVLLYEATGDVYNFLGIAIGACDA